MKIVIFGDSISEGIGKRKINYSNALQLKMSEQCDDIQIVNFAHTGTTIRYMEEQLREYDMDFDIVIIAYGNVDAMLRPDISHIPNYYKYLPNRYKQNGMLNPRPYYSSKLYKSIFQHIDSFIRWNLNKVLLNLQGSITWVSLEEFSQLYEKYVDSFLAKNIFVISLSTVQVKNKYFPGTNNEYIKYNEVISEICNRRNGCVYIDIYNEIVNSDFFYDDGFHPNEKGYKKIAEMISEILKQELNL